MTGECESGEHHVVARGVGRAARAGPCRLAGQGVQYPVQLNIDGTVFKNDSRESEPASNPFLTHFAVSCNDAFAKWYGQIGQGTLAQTARTYYGLNQQWNIGLGEAESYYTIPFSASNGELAQELFGQGKT
jgi:hypothetical protein